MEYNTLCNRVYGDNAGAGKEGALVGRAETGTEGKSGERGGSGGQGRERYRES